MLTFSWLGTVEHNKCTRTLLGTINESMTVIFSNTINSCSQLLFECFLSLSLSLVFSRGALVVVSYGLLSPSLQGEVRSAPAVVSCGPLFWSGNGIPVWRWIPVLRALPLPLLGLSLVSSPIICCEIHWFVAGEASTCGVVRFVAGWWFVVCC